MTTVPRPDRQLRLQEPGVASRWTILVPVKATTRGKSRIDLPPEARQRLALAMALDTVSVAARCGRVMALVENEADAVALQAVPGVAVHLTTVSGLNESILDGVAALAARGVDGLVAVVPGDLPGLLVADLAAGLVQCETHRFAVVADHQGVGTTLLAATVAAALTPRYGPGSYRRHQDAGAVPVLLPTTSSLRRDVDLVTDLETALLGSAVGSRTRAVLADLARPPGRGGPGDRASQQVDGLRRAHGVTVEMCTANSSDPGGSSGT
ncbi:2-phospho-L-lactate guanylyltransferase [Nakamurella sp. UYEF19]|uniref:2-phospho-L-lactate guanylyltransferase n=1 Tax=Nakamurella sp. UYEF19 TaxID=1756392 RepID=UPI003399C6FE